MRALSDIVGADTAPRNRGYSWRREAKFVRDVYQHSTPLDRNQRARLIKQAEGIERRSKEKGRKSGILGQTGLAVLRTLIFDFANRSTGLCCPSIEAIRAKTGFCKQTVVKAIRALEAVGLIKATRRLIRRAVERYGQMMTTCVQGTNLYSFCLDGMISLRPLAVGAAKSFPDATALIPLFFQGLHPGLRNREKPNQGRNQDRSEGREGVFRGLVVPTLIPFGHS